LRSTSGNWRCFLAWAAGWPNWFDPDHLDDTCQALADAVQPDTEETTRREEIRRRIAQLDAELDSYRTILRNEPDAAPTVGLVDRPGHPRTTDWKPSWAASPPPGLPKTYHALVAFPQDITATLPKPTPPTGPPSRPK
jgi:hypothetical protein